MPNCSSNVVLAFQRIIQMIVGEDTGSVMSFTNSSVHSVTERGLGGPDSSSIMSLLGKQ